MSDPDSDFVNALASDVVATGVAVTWHLGDVGEENSMSNTGGSTGVTGIPKSNGGGIGVEITRDLSHGIATALAFVLWVGDATSNGAGVTGEVTNGTPTSNGGNVDDVVYGFTGDEPRLNGSGVEYEPDVGITLPLLVFESESRRVDAVTESYEDDVLFDFFSLLLLLMLGGSGIGLVGGILLCGPETGTDFVGARKSTRVSGRVVESTFDTAGISGGVFGDMLGIAGGDFEGMCGKLGISGGDFDGMLGILGISGGDFDGMLGILGISGGDFDGMLGILGISGGDFEGMLGIAGGDFEGMLDTLGICGGDFVCILGVLGISGGDFEGTLDVLGISGGDLECMLDITGISGGDLEWTLGTAGISGGVFKCTLDAGHVGDGGKSTLT